MSIRERARNAAAATIVRRFGAHAESQDAADAASDVWAEDYDALAEMLADETIAPQKRIDSALAWIKDTLT